jgi:glutamate formiminotransferase/glutamate formiminotransferase/formiminotetrahydrofolate cyclodeaminase
VITGVRKPLVRFNVNLRDPDPTVAEEIAAEIRESSGGLPAVRALGLALPHRGMSQVTMNLTAYGTTSLAVAYRAVLDGAAARGGVVAGTEVIGPVPRAALEGVGVDILESLDPDQVLDEI